MAKQFTKADMKDEVQPAKYAEELCEEHHIKQLKEQVK